jgi:hypothetical protein
MSQSPALPAHRHRGAQPGNANALRHGFYARNLDRFSPLAYDETEMRNLLGEAAMLKDYMYRLYSANIDTHDPTIIQETLHSLSLAGLTLARLLQVHNDIRLFSNAHSSLDTLLTAIDSPSSKDTSHSL